MLHSEFNSVHLVFISPTQFSPAKMGIEFFKGNLPYKEIHIEEEEEMHILIKECIFGYCDVSLLHRLTFTYID